MRGLCVTLVFLLLGAVCPSVGFGWSAPGHRIIAAIAFRLLTPAEQSRIVRMLEPHPRYAEDFASRIPDGVRASGEGAVNEWLFQRAALWPDLVRGLPEEASREFHRPTWHYINRPHFLADADREAMAARLTLDLELDPPPRSSAFPPDAGVSNVVQAIRRARQVLESAEAKPADKALMLSWLFHNVGDLHQPLHSTALFSRRLFPDGDRGGNLIPTRQGRNLHALWDQFPGRGGDDRTARTRALQILADESLVKLGQEAARELDEQVWLEESHELAVTAVYDREVLVFLRVQESGPADAQLPALELSEEYLKTGGEISQRRLVQAGFRLGAILKTIAADP
jgi:hypothetical protein